VESLDDARARGILFGLPAAVDGGVRGVGLLLVAGELQNAVQSVSVSPACSRGLRWPRREVSGYWQRRCLLAHWLKIKNKNVQGLSIGIRNRSRFSR
jgi:hypothetical protein